MLLNPDYWVQKGTATIDECIQDLYDMWLDSKEPCRVIGAIIYGAFESPPSYLLLCDGATYQRVDYPDLYSVILDVLKIDADTFRVPDMRGTWIKAASVAEPQGSVGGQNSVALGVANLPSHTHQYVQGTAGIVTAGTGVPVTVATVPPQLLDTTPTGLGQSFDNQPRYATADHYIVAK